MPRELAPEVARGRPGGIGWGTRDQMAVMGLTPIVTDLKSVEDAARACATGIIENLAQPLGR